MIGTQLENYRVLERIGEGGMGTVYRAFDVMLERDVALKFLHPDLARQPELVERFRAEAIVLARLMHPNIAHVHGLHRHREEFYMAMEYVPGLTLSDLVRRDGSMPLPRAVRIVADVLGALDYAHRQGVVHRDIKTANVIVTPDGTVKVMDFGIARVLGSDRRTRVGTIVGTLGYMSPEQIQGVEVDGRSDLYSLGIVLFELLTGRVPFEAETEWKLMQAQIEQPPPLLRAFIDVPVAVEDAVMRVLAKPPGERFQTAAEFQQAILGAAGLATRQGLSVIQGTEEPQGSALASDTTLHGTAPWNVSVSRTAPAPSTNVTRLTPPPVPTSPAPVSAPEQAASASASGATPAPVLAKAPSGPPLGAKEAAKRGSSTGVAIGAAVLVLAAAGGAGWLWVNALNRAPAGDPVVETAGTGDVSMPAPPPAPALSGPAPAAAVPPPEPAQPVSPPAVPQQSAPGTAVAIASRAAAGGTAAGVKAGGPRAGAQVTGDAGSLKAAAVTSAPLDPTPTRVAPDTAALPPLTFDRVKLVRRTSSSEIEVDAVLSLEVGRVVVFNVNGRNALVTLDLRALTFAEYTESNQTRVFVRTRRYRLRLGAGTDVVELRLDKDNAPKVIEALEQRWGHPVTRGG